MHIACALGHNHAIRKHLARFVQTPHARKQLPVLKVPGHITRIHLEELLKMKCGSRIVTEFHAFKRQPITRKRVRRFISYKLFERFAPRLLCLGHNWKDRIITGAAPRAKRREWKARIEISRCLTRRRSDPPIGKRSTPKPAYRENQ